MNAARSYPKLHHKHFDVIGIAILTIYTYMILVG